MHILEFNNSQLFLIFLICSFIGWCSEVLYVSFFYEHKFVNRGFLYGPICPIYGFGGLIILFILTPWKDTWIQLFFASIIITSTLEYTTSWILETIFQTKWWDYSQKIFNLNGRICLINSLLFGFMGVLGERFLRPFLFFIILSIPATIVHLGAFILFIVFITDLIITLRKLIDFNDTLTKIKIFSESLIDRYTSESWFKSTDITTMINSIRERAIIDKARFSEKFLNKIESFHNLSNNSERWLRRFPSMTSHNYDISLKHLRIRLLDKITEQNNKKKNIRL